MTNATSATAITHSGHTAILVSHMAMLSGRHRRNSTAAIRECFDANADRIEIDVHSLAGDDYAVFHERRLQTETTGEGSIGATTGGCDCTATPIDAIALAAALVAARRGRTRHR